MAGRLFQVADSVQEFEVILNTRPPTFDASRWNRRSRTRRTGRPASPATLKRRKAWLWGLVSTRIWEEVPKLTVGWLASTQVSASGVKASVSTVPPVPAVV